jgi:hypothetical protein
VKTLPVLALLGFLSLQACTRRASPDETFRAFTLSVLGHQSDQAWGMISKESQEALTTATKAAAAAAPKGEIPDDPKAFLFGDDVGLAHPIEEITVAEEKGNVAFLSVKTKDGTHRVRMVLEDGHWKLDLTDGLKL